jgi:hypothetical protein
MHSCFFSVFFCGIDLKLTSGAFNPQAPAPLALPASSPS